jgi:hypothetical protein
MYIRPIFQDQTVYADLDSITYTLTLELQRGPRNIGTMAILTALIRCSIGRPMGCSHGLIVLADGTGVPKLGWLLDLHTQGSLNHMSFQMMELSPLDG